MPEPTSSASHGWAAIQAAYRVVNKASVGFWQIVEPHIRSRVQRMAAQPVALCLQDTGTLDFNGQDIDGLGPLQLRVLRRLEIALALYVVVAWRINRMVRLGRHQPDLEASLLFDVDEIAAAYTMNRSRRLAGESRLPVQVRCKTSIVDAAPLHSTDIATLCTQRFHQML